MKTIKVFRIISEWDIGLHDQYYETFDGAHEAARKALIMSGIDDPIEELIGENLILIDPHVLRIER